MPRERQTRRALLVLIGVVLPAVFTGCLRSSNLRPPAGQLPERSPAGEPSPGGRTVSAPTLRQEPSSASPGPSPAVGPPGRALPLEPNPSAPAPLAPQAGAPQAVMSPA